jgi:MFS family permease
MVAGPSGSSDGDEVYKNLSNNCHASWYRDSGLRRLNIGILLVFSSATANGFDGPLMNGLLAIPAFKEDLVDRVNTSILGLIIAAISIGGLVALIPAGYVSDKWGRKPCLVIGTSLMIATSIVQAFTSGPWAFLATKIILGVGITFILIPAPALATETAHPRNRGMVTACFQTAFYWGAIVSAVATLGGLYIKGSWAWRVPVMMQNCSRRSRSWVSLLFRNRHAFLSQTAERKRLLRFWLDSTPMVTSMTRWSSMNTVRFARLLSEKPLLLLVQHGNSSSLRLATVTDYSSACLSVL